MICGAGGLQVWHGFEFRHIGEWSDGGYHVRAVGECGDDLPGCGWSLCRRLLELGELSFPSASAMASEFFRYAENAEDCSVVQRGGAGAPVSVVSISSGGWDERLISACPSIRRLPSVATLDSFLQSVEDSIVVSPRRPVLTSRRW